MADPIGNFKKPKPKPVVTAVRRRPSRSTYTNARPTMPKRKKTTTVVTVKPEKKGR